MNVRDLSRRLGRLKRRRAPESPDPAIRAIRDLRRLTSGEQRVALVELHNEATGGAVVATIGDGIAWLMDWLAGPALAQALAWIAAGDDGRGFRLLHLRHTFGGLASFEHLGRGDDDVGATWRARAVAWKAATKAALADPRSRAVFGRFVAAMKAVDPAHMKLSAHRRQQSGQAG
ncbi:MAG TPA: hypothetical protein VFG23_05420 [Polyangia bacterium]|nr:hypothetical protein [Polyangia bacterium]